MELIDTFSSPRQCSTSCGAGIMTRQLVCQRTAEDGITSTVSDLECAYVSNKPATERVCNVNIPCRDGVNIQGMNYCHLYNNQINAHALIGQSAMGYCAGTPTEKSRVF